MDRSFGPPRSALRVRPFDDADKSAVVSLWREALPITAPHHDPAMSIRNKPAVERDLFATVVGFYEKLGYSVEELISMGKRLY